MDLRGVAALPFGCLEEVQVRTTLKKLDCFQGNLACDFFMQEFNLTTRKEAEQFGEKLMELGVIKLNALNELTDSQKNKRLKAEDLQVSFQDSSTCKFHFVRDENRFILNKDFDARRKQFQTADLVRLAVNLKKQIMAIFGKFLREDGNGVDYDAAAESDDLVQFKAIASELQLVDSLNLERDLPNQDERKALFLNLYNALVIHGNIVLGHPNTPQERGDFFSNTAYQVGVEIWTLDIIEHGFLRCNHPKPFALTPLLNDPTDSRLSHVLREPLDFRIHFALNCGAKSCPPIRFYQAEKLNEQLDMATKVFLHDESNVSFDIEAKRIQLSKLFDWYGKDVASNGTEMLRKLEPYFLEINQGLLRKLLEEEDLKIEFYPYDWSENKSSKL